MTQLLSIINRASHSRAVEMSQVRQGFLAHYKLVRMAPPPPASGVGLSLKTSGESIEGYWGCIETTGGLNYVSDAAQGQYRDPIAGVIRSRCNPRARHGPSTLYISRHAQQILPLSSHDRSS